MRHVLVRCVLVVTCVTGFALPALAQVPTGGLEAENYPEVEYLIEGLPDDARAIGLTKSHLRTRVELRLREARLVPIDSTNNDSPTPILYVAVMVVGEAFSIDLKFARWVSYIVDSLEYFGRIISWETGNLGTHGGNAAYIIDSMDRYLDQFLNEYLKTNQR